MIRINPVLIHLQSFITEMVDFPVGTLKPIFYRSLLVGRSVKVTGN